MTGCAKASLDIQNNLIARNCELRMTDRIFVRLQTLHRPLLSVEDEFRSSDDIFCYMDDKSKRKIRKRVNVVVHSFPVIAIHSS